MKPRLFCTPAVSVKPPVVRDAQWFVDRGIVSADFEERVGIQERRFNTPDATVASLTQGAIREFFAMLASRQRFNAADWPRVMIGCSNPLININEATQQVRSWLRSEYGVEAVVSLHNVACTTLVAMLNEIQQLRNSVGTIVCSIEHSAAMLNFVPKPDSRSHPDRGFSSITSMLGDYQTAIGVLPNGEGQPFELLATWVNNTLDDVDSGVHYRDVPAHEYIEDALTIKSTKTAIDQFDQPVEGEANRIWMDGFRVFKIVPGLMQRAADEVLKVAKIGNDKVKWLVPHAASERFREYMEKICPRVLMNTCKTGNTGNCTVAYGLEAYRNEFSPGDIILSTVAGANYQLPGKPQYQKGMSYGAAIFRATEHV